MRLLLVCLVVLVVAGPLAAEPFVPASDSVVVERLPSSPFADPELRRRRAELAQEPENLALATGLARRYLEMARAEGDPRWIGYAQAVLAPWWEDEVPPPGVLALRAALRQNRHEFGAALGDLEQLLRRDPRNASAWLTRAVVLQVRGDLAGAQQSCRIVQRLERSVLSYACLANVASLTGGAEAGYELLQRAVGESTGESVGGRAWALVSLAQIAEGLGRGELAERHYREALKLGANDIYTRAAYADFLLDRDRASDVLELLDGETLSDAMYLRLALASSQLARPETADHVRALESRFAASRRRGEKTHLGNEARFALHLQNRPAAALELALANWEVQKEPINARHVLEAALAANQPEAVRPVTSWIESVGLEDVRLARLTDELEPHREAGP